MYRKCPISNVLSLRQVSATSLVDFPADTDLFKTSSGHLKKVTTSYNQTRHRHIVIVIVMIYKVFRTSGFQRPEDVSFTSSSRRPICNVLKTPDLQRLQDIWFTTSWRRPIYVYLFIYLFIYWHCFKSIQ